MKKDSRGLLRVGASKFFSACGKFPDVPLFRPNPFIEDDSMSRGCHSTVKPAKKSFVNISSYDGDLSLPLGLALGSPIFPSGCEGKLGVALESLQGLRDLT